MSFAVISQTIESGLSSLKNHTNSSRTLKIYLILTPISMLSDLRYSTHLCERTRLDGDRALQLMPH